MTFIDFAYLRPATLAEALTLLAATEQAIPLASGTDVLMKLRYERIHPQALIDLSGLAELRGIRSIEGGLWLGPLTTMSEVAQAALIREQWAALAEGAQAVGSLQIRNLATVGGNVCNASPAADTIPALLVAQAQAELTGPTGQRTLPLVQFFTGPGQTALQPGELLTGLFLPSLGPYFGSTYLRHCIRRQLDLAAVGVAAALTLNEAGHIVTACIALGAVAPTPLRAYEAEQCVIASGILNEKTLHDAAQLAIGATRPISDLRATADYRRHMVGVLTRRALQGAYRRAQMTLEN
ncbi:MAG: xanthine dehydrogenase family protein subunit M [Anaerolineae bacterium]